MSVVISVVGPAEDVGSMSRRGLPEVGDCGSLR
eukprot:CAMPEP_0184685426 /NCGR_PEP_ID=MMETSP0312-20130426/18930_1 /TAXON_ID=31354 /ORGANISM="Compsopogon coeruleus, Strain SAG 36.94" /LENGTH=32 /DNA_ID= /DNA_START= /DNA_END= /DNA_ORIENTATION=